MKVKILQDCLVGKQGDVKNLLPGYAVTLIRRGAAEEILEEEVGIVTSVKTKNGTPQTTKRGTTPIKPKGIDGEETCQ